jgi:hypothetical protein
MVVELVERDNGKFSLVFYTDTEREFTVVEALKHAVVNYKDPRWKIDLTAGTYVESSGAGIHEIGVAPA